MRHFLHLIFRPGNAPWLFSEISISFLGRTLGCGHPPCAVLPCVCPPLCFGATCHDAGKIQVHGCNSVKSPERFTHESDGEPLAVIRACELSHCSPPSSTSYAHSSTHLHCTHNIHVWRQDIHTHTHAHRYGARQDLKAPALQILPLRPLPTCRSLYFRLRYQTRIFQVETFLPQCQIRS